VRYLVKGGCTQSTSLGRIGRMYLCTLEIRSIMRSSNVVVTPREVKSKCERILLLICIIVIGWEADLFSIAFGETTPWNYFLKIASILSFDDYVFFIFFSSSSSSANLGLLEVKSKILHTLHLHS
jgi:hypothetical protein